MLKTNKSLTKRIKITKNGKKLVRAKGQDHFNAKERTSTRMSKKKMGDIVLTKKEVNRNLPYAKKGKSTTPKRVAKKA